MCSLVYVGPRSHESRLSRTANRSKQATIAKPPARRRTLAPAGSCSYSARARVSDSIVCMGKAGANDNQMNIKCMICGDVGWFSVEKYYLIQSTNHLENMCIATVGDRSRVQTPRRAEPALFVN